MEISGVVVSSITTIVNAIRVQSGGRFVPTMVRGEVTLKIPIFSGPSSPSGAATEFP